MKVEELIQKLNDCPQDAEVQFAGFNTAGDYVSDVVKSVLVLKDDVEDSEFIELSNEAKEEENATV